MAEELSVSLHEAMEEARLEHGLRNGLDVEAYRTYRQYCGRRVRRVRKASKLVCGKGRHYTRRDVTLENVGTLTAQHLLLAQRRRLAVTVMRGG